MNLYVGNLSPETTEQQLKDAFSEFGAIKSVKIIIDPQTGFPKGFGFVEMEDKRGGYEAITNLDMTYLHGTIISVKEAKNNKQQGGGSRPGGSRPFQRRSDSGGYNRQDGGGYNRQDGGGYNRQGGSSYGDRRQSSDRPVYSRRPNFNSDNYNNNNNNNNNSLDY